jgi:hypothetical protein
MPKCRYCGYCIGYEVYECTHKDVRKPLSYSQVIRSNKCPHYQLANVEDDRKDILDEVVYKHRNFKPRGKKHYDKLKLFDLKGR